MVPPRNRLPVRYAGISGVWLLALELGVFPEERVALLKHYAQSNESEQVFHDESLSGV